jgi:hypothetical protein
MYHRHKNFSIKSKSFAIALLSAINLLTCGAAQAQEADRGLLTTLAPPLSGNVNFVQSEFPKPPKGRVLKKKPEQISLFEWDKTPLGSRAPFLLVHGLRGEYYPNFRWEKVVKRFVNNSDFSSQYKVYFLRYDSTAREEKIVPQFRQAIATLSRTANQRPITIMALSIGGNLVYEGMLDKETDQRIRLAMTLGTPFHGSPLFNQDWIQYSVYKNFAMPWTHVDHSLAFRLYFNRNPNLLQDFNWDDVDNSIPDAGHFRSWLPLGPHGNLIAKEEQNTRLLALNNNSTFDKKKLIAYSCYLVNPYMESEARRVIQSAVLAPVVLFTMKLPAHLAREHAVLNLLNSEIGSVVSSKEAIARAGTRFPYQLNDGIAPVASALFLPDNALQSKAIAKERDLPTIKAAADVRIARVFRNADHLTFIDGFRPMHTKSLLRDELNPESGTRNIFDWMLTDLLQTREPAEDLAAASKASKPEN